MNETFMKIFDDDSACLFDKTSDVLSLPDLFR